MKSKSLLVAIILLCLFTIPPAFGDSDSFYCIGRGYIAFDLRSFIHPSLNSPHVLRLYRFEAERGIYKAAEWPMKDFQIHTMRCTQHRIAITGSDNAKYVFDVVQENQAKADDDIVSSLEGQLGWSAPEVKGLESDDLEHKYQLVVSSLTEGSEFVRKAELFQKDSNGKVSQSVLLYELREPRYNEPAD